MKRERKIKGWIVRAGTGPYMPAYYLGAFTIFKTKATAEYWRDTRVHEGNRKEVVACTITYTIPKRLK